MRNNEDATAIYLEAKKRVDSLLDISPDEYNPSLETASFFRASLRPMRLYLGVLMIGIGGSMFINGDPIKLVINTALVALGAAGISFCMRASIFGSSVTQIAEYDKDNNRILALRSRRSIMLYALAHEYGHAVTTDKFREGNSYFGFREGFCIGLGLAVQGITGMERANSLSISISRLELAKKALRRLGSIDKEDKKEKYSAKTMEGLYMLGYSIFRLAEERHGADVYREVYSGNTKLLFE